MLAGHVPKSIFDDRYKLYPLSGCVTRTGLVNATTRTQSILISLLPRCTLCLVHTEGTYTSRSGSIVCTDCSFGRYTDQKGQT